MSKSDDGPRNEPEFESTGNPPTFAADLTLVSKYAADYGNLVIGTTAERNAFSSPWDGLMWSDTDLNVTLRYDGSGWVYRGTPITKVARSTNQTLTGTYTAITWSSAPIAYTGGWSAGNPTRIVLPIAGLWEVTYSCPATGASDGRAVRAYITKEGTIDNGSYDERAGGTSVFEPHVKGSAIVSSNGSNWVDVRVSTTNTGGTPQVTSSSTAWAKYLGVNP